MNKIPEIEELDNDIQDIRSQLINKILVFVLLLIPFGLLLSIFRIVEFGWRNIYFVQITLCGVIIISALFRNRLSFNIRAYTILGTLLILGIYSLFTFGLVGGGTLIIISFSIWVSIFFGKKIGIITSIISTIIIIVIGVAFAKSLIMYSFDIYDYATSFKAWAVVASAVLVYSSIIITSIGFMYKYLTTSLQNTKESEKKYRELTDSLPQIVYEIDIDGNITFANKKAFESFGYSQEEFEKGVNFKQIFIAEDLDRVKKNFQNILRGENVLNIEYTALRKDGAKFPALTYSNPIFKDGKPIGVRGVFIDITEQKKLENELRKYRENLEELVDKRTTELEEKNKELENFNDLFIGREHRIKELKDQLKKYEENNG